MDKAIPKVSVIILNHNDAQYLGANISSLRSQTYRNFKVIVADNHSQDNSVELVKSLYPEVEVLTFGKNYGFAEGYNRAIEAVNSEYVVLLNCDMEADNNFLSELVEAAKKEEGIAVCASKIIFYGSRNIINHAGGQITMLGSGYDIGFGEKDSLEFNAFKYVSYACGGAMLIKRRIFQELGGFDNNYFIYSEDADLCWRAWLYGYKVLYIPSSVVFHKYRGGMSPYSYNAFKIYLGQKNRLTNVIKNFEVKNVIISLIINFSVSLFKIISLLLSGLFFRQIYWLIKGYIKFLAILPDSIKKRSIVQKNRKIKDDVLFRMGIIENISGSIREYRRLNRLGC
ncbi:MAG: glycosyltransferase family 2 protein [Candidatus Omnitrophica bacterium]|nr:glycosyltransferase family 2 protein [Candidatus Omnitrophota bacterium]